MIDPKDAIAIARRSLDHLHSNRGTRDDAIAVVREITEAYQLSQSWKTELWASLPAQQQRWLKPSGDPNQKQGIVGRREGTPKSAG